MTLQNSPGHRPRACQNPSTSPQSLVTVPFGYWTPVLESRRIPFMVSLGGVSGLRLRSIKLRIPVFSPSKINSEIDHFFNGFWEPKWTKNPSKNHKKSIPEAIQKPNPQKQEKTYRNIPSQTLKIELSCTRDAYFHYFTVFKNTIKS